MDLLYSLWAFLFGTPEVFQAVLTFTIVKRFKPQAGIRRGIVDITFDTGGPTWAVLATDLRLTRILKLHLPAHVGGYVLGDVPVVGNASVTIDAREEADGGTLMQAIDASDLNALVARCEYVGS